MLKLLLLLGLAYATVFDNKIITHIRNGLERNLKYIEKNYDRVKVDCMFGVVLATGEIFSEFVSYYLYLII